MRFVNNFLNICGRVILALMVGWLVLTCLTEFRRVCEFARSAWAVVGFAALFVGWIFADKQWLNHAMFRRPSLWFLGVLATLAMAVAGIVYGLLQFCYRIN
jgi:hypothetical protein